MQSGMAMGGTGIRQPGEGLRAAVAAGQRARRLLASLALLLAVAALAGGCASTAPPPRVPGGAAMTAAAAAADPAEVAGLARALAALGADPGEARRAAGIAYAETRRLAQAYEIEDPPLIHNTLVNLGLKPRGLCWQWADDLEARLRQEEFETLELHRAIANADAPFQLDHSAVIVSRRGHSMFEGVVLDPWRRGGVLHWTPVLADADYDWQPRSEVMAERSRQAALDQGRGTPRR